MDQEENYLLHVTVSKTKTPKLRFNSSGFMRQNIVALIVFHQLITGNFFKHKIIIKQFKYLLKHNTIIHGSIFNVSLLS